MDNLQNHDLTHSFQEQIKDAVNQKNSLHILGGNSKNFIAGKNSNTTLHTQQHKGIISYEPTELVITARSGTPLSEIKNLLADSNQMLAFDPPEHTNQTTIGGAIASGMSGPIRPWLGSARDMVLGTKIIDSRAQVLTFGGQVMKNVAGYDVSRLMSGSYGSLALLSEISIKVLPAFVIEKSISIDLNQNQAKEMLLDLSNKASPLSATCFYNDELKLRFSGQPSAVNFWVDKFNGKAIDNDYWHSLRDQKLDFFTQDKKLWRLSLPAFTPKLDCETEACLVEWAGAQRWFYSDKDEKSIFDEALKHGGHATLYKNTNDQAAIFQPLDPVNQQIQERLKSAFDPNHLFM